MFTGLIEEQGAISHIDQLPDAIRVTVRAQKVLEDVHRGDSIAVSGVCLTVLEFSDTHFTADVMQQTLNMSTLSTAGIGTPVNLERAALADKRLGGHIVQGHVDGTATIVSINASHDWTVIRFSLSDDLAQLLVDKGSVTIDGVSLTVSNISHPSESSQWFEVSLIPETLSVTTLGSKQVGEKVNIETDIIARHVARMLSFLPQKNGGA